MAMLLELRVYAEQYLRGFITADIFQYECCVMLCSYKLSAGQKADDNMTELADVYVKLVKNNGT